MTASLFIGAALVAFGPATAVFLMTVGNKAQLLIVSIASAFIWVCSLTLAAIIWTIATPLKSEYWFYVPMGVIIQELGRMLFFNFYEKGEMSFLSISTNGISFPLTDISASVAAGLGFGLAQSVIIFGSILSNATGEATLFSPECEDISTFVLSSWTAFCFIFLQLFLMVVSFDAYRRNELRRVFYVFLLHLAASCVTVLNTYEDGCYYSLALLILVVFAGAGGLMWMTIHNQQYRSLKD